MSTVSTTVLKQGTDFSFKVIKQNVNFDEEVLIRFRPKAEKLVILAVIDGDVPEIHLLDQPVYDPAREIAFRHARLIQSEIGIRQLVKIVIDYAQFTPWKNFGDDEILLHVDIMDQETLEKFYGTKGEMYYLYGGGKGGTTGAAHP